MQIQPHEIHLFTADLDAAFRVYGLSALLSPDECARAERFHFDLHRQRFIAGRCLLRMVLGAYTQTAPEKIIFAYEEKKKPFLENHPLQFNLAHSEQMMVLALTMHHAIGVDIEKIKMDYEERVAHRYFSDEENHALQQLAPEERAAMFYTMWAKKEALVKATGKGLSAPLSGMNDEDWALIPLAVHTDFQAAVATNQHVEKLIYWEWKDGSPVLMKEVFTN
jgi:4'-phosphopantetheinyl transferase